MEAAPLGVERLDAGPGRVHGVAGGVRPEGLLQSESGAGGRAGARGDVGKGLLAVLDGAAARYMTSKAWHLRYMHHRQKVE